MTERMPSRQTGERTGSRPSAAEGGGASRASLEAGRSPVYLSAQLLPGDRAFLPPSSRGTSPRNLTSASGGQDHTTSPSAHAPIVLGTRASTASRAQRPWRRVRPSQGVRDRRSIVRFGVRSQVDFRKSEHACCDKL